MKAIILAAGHGTRMLPITKTIPKELLPVGTKPVIHYIVEGLSQAGIKDMLIVTSQSKKALEDYFDKNFELEHLLETKGKHKYLKAINEPKSLGNFTFVKQSEQKGTGHAIMQAAPWINDDFVMVVYGDTIYHPKIYKEMVELHKEFGKGIMCLKEVPEEDVSKYGIARLEDGYFIDVIEKPTKEEAPSNMAVFTPYIVPGRFLELLMGTEPDAKSGEIYPWPALKQIMANKEMLGYVTEHSIRDTGNPESWLKANMEIGRDPDLLT